MKLNAKYNQLTGFSLVELMIAIAVIGILAARLKEKFHRPVIAFARASADEIKGSARSVSGVNIRDCLEAVSTRHPGLIRKFGGHAMAAGLSLAERDYTVFQALFDAEVSRHLSADNLHGVVHSDGGLDGDAMNLEMADQLRSAGPWGQNFPEPIFEGVFEVIHQRIVGERHLKLSLRADNNAQLDAIAFNQEDLSDKTGLRVNMAYRLDANEFRGMRNLQLVVEHLELFNG